MFYANWLFIERLSGKSLLGQSGTKKIIEGWVTVGRPSQQTSH